MFFNYNYNSITLILLILANTSISASSELKSLETLGNETVIILELDRLKVETHRITLLF